MSNQINVDALNQIVAAAVAAALKENGIIVAGEDGDPADAPQAPAVHPKWAEIKAITKPVTRSLRWVTLSGNSKDRRIFISLAHTDKRRHDTPQYTKWILGWRVDLDGDPAEVDRVVAEAVRVAKAIDDGISGLLPRLGLDQSCPTLWDNGNGVDHD